MTDGQRKRDLKRAYKERPRPAGIYKIENTVDGKLLLGSSLDLDGSLERHRFMLQCESHRNAGLQADWKRLGPDAFAFEILEVVEPSRAPDFDLDDELTLLELLWIDRIDAAGHRSYNTGPKIRDI